MEHFTNDGFRFEVTDTPAAGGSRNAEVAVLLHGFPEDRHSWDAVTPALAEAGYRVLAPDLRGYSPGARPAARRAYTLARLAGDVTALADAAGAERFHVVGHDWGGGVAWELAANHAERVRTVTSMATPHPMAMVKAMTRSTQLFKSYYMVMFQLPAVPESAFTGRMQNRTWASMAKSGLGAEYIEEYRQLFEEPGTARGALNWYRALPLGSSTGVGPVHIPAMYVYGTKDFALGRKAADLTGEYVKGPYRYEILDGVSHWIPEEVPETAAELVLDFVGSVKP